MLIHKVVWEVVIFLVRIELCNMEQGNVIVQLGRVHVRTGQSGERVSGLMYNAAAVFDVELKISQS